MFTPEAKQKVFDHCLKRSGFQDGVGVGTVGTLKTLFACMRIRLTAENANDDEQKAFVEAIAHAIRNEPKLNAKDEIEKLLRSAFDGTTYVPPATELLATSVNFLSRVRF